MKKIINYLFIKVNSVIYFFSPRLASEFVYFKAFRKKLNLNNPTTFNEKIQWLKLYWQHPLVAKCADKFDMFDYVKSCNCNKILNEVYGVYTDANDIDYNKLPNKFALKGTHGCGFNIICTDKTNLNYKDTNKQLNKWLRTRYALVAAECQYDKMKPKIICEKYIEGKNSSIPEDYKVYCFNGKPLFTMACVGRENGKAKYYFYDNDWRILPYNKTSIESKENIKKPDSLEKMIKYSEILSKPFPFVRMDFYDTAEGPILGEMTFTPAGGIDNVLSYDIDKLMGDLIKLPKKYEVN
ncbi:ATP-grasp fold amidoligase family protein [Clostridium perfringens]|uniref:ATP-grasp fold amidoligase family protein n=1 Tax=Clostridium perfringens TaxID=1502 RepID=UPI0039ED4ADA